MPSGQSSAATNSQRWLSSRSERRWTSYAHPRAGCGQASRTPSALYVARPLPETRQVGRWSRPQGRSAGGGAPLPLTDQQGHPDLQACPRVVARRTLQTRRESGADLGRGPDCRGRVRRRSRACELRRGRQLWVPWAGPEHLRLCFHPPARHGEPLYRVSLEKHAFRRPYVVATKEARLTRRGVTVARSTVRVPR